MTDIVEQGRAVVVGDEYKMRQLLCAEIERLRDLIVRLYPYLDERIPQRLLDEARKVLPPPARKE